MIWHRNSTTGLIFPSIPTIATESGLGKRTVSRTISQLKKTGILHVDDKKGKSNRYTVFTHARAASTHARVAPKPLSNHCAHDIEGALRFNADLSEAEKTEMVWRRPELEEDTKVTSVSLAQ